MAPKSLYTQLDACLERSLGENEKFLPLSALSNKITKQNVKETLPFVMRLLPRGLVRKITGQAKKLFAILVLIGEPQSIKELLSEKITDQDLPFSRRNTGDDILQSSQGQDLHCFADWRHPAKVDNFLEKQWCVLAPVLDFSGKHISISERKTLLPILETKEMGGGTYSRVFKSTIHSAHRPDSSNQDLEIALKKFNKDTDFFKERKTLEDIYDIKNPHLIHYLTTWEYREDYYIIFPWANGGNLKQLWTRDNISEVGSAPVLWALQQMLGLCSAVRDLHQKNCRHGDLKPENILYFNTNDKNILVVADVGVSKIHNVDTRLRKDGTSTNATTPSYEPPEVMLKKDTPRSRKYDIWSLGCIYLQFINWLLYGFAAVKALDDGGRPPELVFYEMVDPKTPRLRPDVIRTMERLRQDERCRGTPIETLVNLIAERLLMVEVDDRDTADELYENLKRIVDDSSPARART